MTKHILDKDLRKTWEIDSDNDTWILARDAEIKVSGKHGIADDGHAGATIRVFGDITVKGADSFAVYATGEGSKVIFGKDAHIDASHAAGGLMAAGTDATAINNGFIEAGSDYGLRGGWGSLLVNNGAIKGHGGLHSFTHAGEATEARNDGLIKVSDIGMSAAGSSDSYAELTNGSQGKVISADVGVAFTDGTWGFLTNHGLIKGANFAVTDGAGEATLVNTGRIIGTIDMGGGHDVLDFTKGTLKGVAYGGEGADVYKISSQDIDIREHFLGGADLVLSTASYTLKSNFEYFELLGTKNLDGTGNNDANHLTGNSGNNALSGMDGADRLSGGLGNDTLDGGAGIDTFVFSSNFGSDVISDFENGIDKLDISGWNGVDSLHDLTTNHMMVDGNDLVLHNGTDTLRIKNMSSGELDISDFAL